MRFISCCSSYSVDVSNLVFRTVELDDPVDLGKIEPSCR